ncbi:MAG: beta-glucosidase [Microbacteriaceae bacterium]|nr:MAG: beta-glucosidase [Microbacteriaceae bacterium]
MSSAPYRDAQAPIESRVADLLSRMSLEEKLAQLGTFFPGVMPAAEHDAQLDRGVGHVSLLVSGDTVDDNLATIEHAQERVMAATGHGIPALVHQEALSGPMLVGGTNFPGAIALAATWDPERVERMAEITGAQLAAMGVHLAFSPVLDIARDPRWGRIGETYGEDPTLAAAMGVAYVRGLQGNDLSSGVAATAKHFLGYAMSLGGLNMAATHLAWRELREVYAKPFAAAIVEAGLACVMNSYSTIDGVPVAANRDILTGLLRDELGFDGVTISDYGAVQQLRHPYATAGSAVDAGRAALIAGLDVEAPDFASYAALAGAVADGSLDEAVVDAAVARVLRLKFRLGLFERPLPDRERIAALTGRASDDDLAIELAAKSLVLLRNDGSVLPLAPTGRIAVIGPNADTVRPLFGSYSYPAAVELRTGVASGQQGVALTVGDPSSRPTAAELDARFRELYPSARSILEAIREAAPSAEVTFARGCELTGDDTVGFEEAIAAARAADVAVLVVGGKDGWGVETCTTGEGLDTMHVGLTGVQADLVRAVHATGTPVVIVHVAARPLSEPWIAEHVPAIIQAWHPGQGGGIAIADALFGAANPGGKLPITAVRDEGQIPNYYAHPRGSGYAGRAVSIWNPTEYVDGTGKPLFPFGHGLSYTEFAYDAPTVEVGDDVVTVSCVVTNTGARDGDEVVQLYVADRVASVVRPVKELAGFRRIHLDAGESARVTFTIRTDQLAFLGLERRWIVEPGWFDVEIGASSDDIRLRAEFELTQGLDDVGVVRGYVAASDVEPADGYQPVAGSSSDAPDRLGLDTPVGILAADPDAAELLRAFVPEDAPQSDAFNGLTLRQIAQYAPGIFTDDVLASIAAQLAELQRRRDPS